MSNYKVIGSNREDICFVARWKRGEWEGDEEEIAHTLPLFKRVDL